MKRIIMALAFVFLSLSYTCAGEITILYTGDTRSALYPCHCPTQPDGGLARRLSKIKELRTAYPNLLLVDAGNLFAGGPLDYNSQNTDLDKKRTQVTLAALKLMQYDAVALGFEEFNFGKDFLFEQISQTGIPFVSGNVKSDKILPYVIKDVAGVKVAILGLTTLQAKDKAPELEFIKPLEALKAMLLEVKNKGAEIVVLLTNFLLEEEQDLIKEVPGIDILIAAGTKPKGRDKEKIGSTIVLRTVREGRRLGEIKLILKDKKIVDYKMQEIRLSNEIKDDPQIQAILPRCFSNRDCPKKEGLVSQCKDAGKLNAQCVFSEAPKVSLTVIKSKACRTCNIEAQAQRVKNIFANTEVTYIDYESSRGRELARLAGLDALPIFLFGREIEKDKTFEQIKSRLELKADYYLVKPEFIGISYFPTRKRIKDAFDLFISLFDKNTAELMDIVEPFKPKIHFLAVEDPKDLSIKCRYGTPEIEEDLRAVCVIKYYPDKAFDYLKCRAKNIESSWWDDCAPDIDINKIKSCAKTKMGMDLLRENIKLNKELLIMFGPTYLLSNQEIFSSQTNPSVDELRKVIEAQK